MVTSDALHMQGEAGAAVLLQVRVQGLQGRLAHRFAHQERAGRLPVPKVRSVSWCVARYKGQFCQYILTESMGLWEVRFPSKAKLVR